MGHVTDHCGTPKITRSWKALGVGAVWACDCGRLYRLATCGSYDGYVWQWNAVKSG